MVEKSSTGDDGPLTLTTEAWHWGLRLLAFLILFGGVGAVLTVGAYPSGRPIEEVTVDRLPALIALIALNAILLASGSFVAWLGSWGTWFIERDGIRFQPSFGRPRALRWAEVERVIWKISVAVLRGRSVSIPRPWAAWPRSQVERGRVRISNALALDFDLTPDMLGTWPPISTCRGIRLVLHVGLRVAALVLCLAIGFWVSIRSPLPEAMRVYVFEARSLILPLPLLWWDGATARRERRIAHPESPWRTRIERH